MGLGLVKLVGQKMGTGVLDNFGWLGHAFSVANKRVLVRDQLSYLEALDGCCPLYLDFRERHCFSRPSLDCLHFLCYVDD